MNSPPSQGPAPLPPTDALEARMQALMKLRRQMIELHARLEYLRLMLRMNRPMLAQRNPRG
jgi:hypothetical protein